MILKVKCANCKNVLVYVDKPIVLPEDVEMYKQSVKCNEPEHDEVEVEQE